MVKILYFQKKKLCDKQFYPLLTQMFIFQDNLFTNAATFWNTKFLKKDHYWILALLFSVKIKSNFYSISRSTSLFSMTEMTNNDLGNIHCPLQGYQHKNVKLCTHRYLTCQYQVMCRFSWPHTGVKSFYNLYKHYKVYSLQTKFRFIAEGDHLLPVLYVPGQAVNWAVGIILSENQILKLIRHTKFHSVRNCGGCQRHKLCETAQINDKPNNHWMTPI